MKILKQYLSVFLALVAICSTLSISSARSWIYDWDYYSNKVCYQNMIKVDAKVLEDVGMGVKSNVRVQNINISSCYVKAMVVFTAIDKNGNPENIDIKVGIQGEEIEGEEYDVLIKFPEENSLNHTWFAINDDSTLISDYYTNVSSDKAILAPYSYIYSAPLTTNEESEILIESITCTESGLFAKDSEYKLKVDILTEAIYEGEKDTWLNLYNLESNNRILSKKS